MFMSDYEFGYTADRAIVRRLVTALNYGQYDFGTAVLRKNTKALGVYFV